MPTVQNRRGTAANLTAANPVLSAGEIAFETDTGRFKLGDGTTAWSSLPYNDSAVGSANQIIYKNPSNVTSGNSNLTFNSTTNTLSIQNISLTGNTISSTDTNGNINLVPNINGDINLDTDTTRIGDSADIGSAVTANLLLLRFDGNLTDSSIYARTATAAGNATTSTAQRKFGTHSALFDGSGDRIDIPSSADFNLGGADHTVDFWMWINSSVNGINERLVVFEGTTQTRGIVIDNLDKTKIGVNLFGTGYQILSATGAISNQTWIHVALVRSGTTTTLYVNGTSVGSTTSQCLPTTNSSVSIGGNVVRFVDNNYNGYIDEVRIVNSAVWTSNFTPPTSQYSQYLNPNATLTTTGTLNLVLNTNSGTNSGSITIAQGANANITLSPNGTGDVYADADTLRVGDANAAATITTNGTGNLILNTNAGTNSGSITINQGANGNIAVSPNGTGTVSIGTSLTLGSGGIIFPAAATISSNANTLDDYEEGTWTPTYTCSTANPTVTYTAQHGTYVKIGRAVHIHCRITISTRSGGTGNLRISGLPFAATGAAAPVVQGGYGQCNTMYKGSWTTNGPDGGYTEAGQTYINLTWASAGGIGFNQITITNLTAGAVDLMISGSYETDS